MTANQKQYYCCKMSKPLTVHMFVKIIFFKVPRETVNSIELPFKVEIEMSKSSTLELCICLDLGSNSDLKIMT